MLANIQYLSLFRRGPSFDHGECAKPVCPRFCERLGSGCSIRFKVPGAFYRVFVICHLTAAKLGGRKRCLLHLDGYSGLYDSAFFHAAQGHDTMKNLV